MIYDPIPYKRCTKCGESLPIIRFNRAPRNNDGWGSWCRECKTIAARQKYQENPEKSREPATRYRKRNHDLVLQRTRQWRAQHPDKVSEEHKRYNAAHPGYQKDKTRQRRLRVNKAEGTHTYADELAQLKRQKTHCYYCHEKIKDNEWHADHIVPLSRGGSDWPDNIVIACPHCNLEKHNKLPHEWPKGGRLL